MTTTFVERRLFNDDLCSHVTSFIWNRKGWAESKLGEIQRERVCETERCYKRVAAWVINLTVGYVIMIASERIIRGLIKMIIRIISRI
jgi:hypothetical protein